MYVINMVLPWSIHLSVILNINYIEAPVFLFLLCRGFLINIGLEKEINLFEILEMEDKL